MQIIALSGYRRGLPITFSGTTDSKLRQTKSSLIGSKPVLQKSSTPKPLRMLLIAPVLTLASLAGTGCRTVHMIEPKTFLTPNKPVRVHNLKLDMNKTPIKLTGTWDDEPVELTITGNKVLFILDIKGKIANQNVNIKIRPDLFNSVLDRQTKLSVKGKFKNKPLSASLTVDLKNSQATLIGNNTLQNPLKILLNIKANGSKGKIEGDFLGKRLSITCEESGNTVTLQSPPEQIATFGTE